MCYEVAGNTNRHFVVACRTVQYDVFALRGITTQSQTAPLFKNSSKLTASMASLERNSVRKMEPLIYKDFATFTNQCALEPSKSLSITQSILRRQMAPTKTTNDTVKKQACTLKRERRVPKGSATIWSPLWLESRKGRTPHPKSLLNFLPCSSSTIVESKNTSSSNFLSPQEKKKLGCTIIGDRLVLENPDELLKKLKKSTLAVYTTNLEGSGGTVTIKRKTLLLTTTMDG